MTKRRPPLTFFAALCRVAELIGMDGCAQILGKSESLVRKLSDPDAEREISLRDARRLDAAFRRAGGDHTPFHDCYALQLELESGDARPSRADMIAAAAAVAKETGEAVSAALAAIEDKNCKATRSNALREIEEGIVSLTAMANQLGAASVLEDRG